MIPTLPTAEAFWRDLEAKAKNRVTRTGLVQVVSDDPAANEAGLCECKEGLSLAEVQSNECVHCGRPLIVLELDGLHPGARS
jgi:hypothetical protein